MLEIYRQPRAAQATAPTKVKMMHLKNAACCSDSTEFAEVKLWGLVEWTRAYRAFVGFLFHLVGLQLAECRSGYAGCSAAFSKLKPYKEKFNDSKPHQNAASVTQFNWFSITSYFSLN